MSKEKVAIIIPALNEAKTIIPVIDGVRNLGTVIVVNDGSTDDTVAVSKKAGAHVVTHDVNQGYDMALYTGFSEAEKLGMEFIVSIDADGQHNPQYLESVLTPLISGNAKMSLAYRDKPARLTEYIFRIVAKKLYGINDILCGLKGFHVDLFKAHKAVMQKNTLGTGMAVQCARAGHAPAQVPIIVEDRADTPRIGRMIRANWIIFKGMIIALAHK